MPTYEYACRDCGSRLEVVQAFTDEPLRECPTCQGSLRKVFGAVGISFKGSGFYKTDSRSTSSARSNGDKDKDGKGAEKVDSKSDTKTDGGKADTKTESKPETKESKKPEKKKESTSTPAKSAS